jgi:hypothetical protein
MDKLRDELNSKFFTTPSWNKKFWLSIEMIIQRINN